MDEFAHCTIGTARRAVLAVLLATAAGQDGQEVDVAAAFAAVDAIAVRALDSGDPVTRGEAALWLAQSGRAEHYAAFLALAQDEAPAARHRAILALGMLGAPGAEAFLGRLLVDSDPDEDAELAAFALGLLDDAQPVPAIDALLRRVQGGSRRRFGPALGALLAGLGTAPHPSRAVWLREVRDDPTSRSDALVVLAQAALDHCDQPLTRAEALAFLDHDAPSVRRLGLRAWRPAWRPGDAETNRIVHLARGDADPGVRAEALALLGRLLDRRALDLAERAAASRFAEEAGTGARVWLALAGDAARAAIEARILNGRVADDVRAALLGVLPAPLPPPILLLCHDLAHGDGPFALRTAAALALARADSVLAPAALATVFFAGTADHAHDLVRLAEALRALDRLPAVQAELVGKAALDDLPGLAARLRALAAVEPLLGCEVLLALAADDRLSGAAVGGVLGALRKARGTRVASEHLALLPRSVASLEP